jgi:predicted dehydrogenase
MQRASKAGSSRRTFLAATTALGLAGAGARLPAQDARAAPNDRITLGFIGVGGMGTGLLNIFKGMPDVDIAAVCDVYEPHALRAKEAAGGKPEVVGDFRKILDRRDVDAVVVATPDHWHAIPTILACQAEKDVYCEKPLAWSIGEGRRVADATSKYKRVTQMGNLIHASETYHRMVEIVRSGVLGKIAKGRIWMAGQQTAFGHPPDGPPPEGCDYDMWLGPAPARPFNPNRFTFNWRWFWDCGGGWLADFICHLYDPVAWALELDAPERIVASGGRYTSDDNGETPDTFEVTYEYPHKGFELTWSHQSHNGHGFEGRGAGVMFIGEKGVLHGHYNDFKVIPAGKDEIALPEPSLPRSPGHHREWIDAIKSRVECSCHFGYGHRITTVGHLGNIAIRTGDALKWDRAGERFVNNDAANGYLFRKEYRKPWTLPEV